LRGGKKVGKWKKGRFNYNGKEYSYNLIWDTGFLDYLNLDDGDRCITGINSVGTRILDARK
jgi:hypothetical protein